MSRMKRSTVKIKPLGPHYQIHDLFESKGSESMLGKPFISRKIAEQKYDVCKV